MPLPSDGAPEARSASAQVWTGSALLVWAGVHTALAGELRTGGACVLPGAGWRATSVSDGLQGREDPCFVWTGKVLWVWGGSNADGDVPPPQLAKYDPQGDAWDIPAMAGWQPEPRAATTAVWTGTQVLIFGGTDVSAAGLNSGGVYDSASGTWSPMAALGAPSARYAHLAVWTGTRMLVWGGGYGPAVAQSGASYDPQADQWTTISAAGGPMAAAPTGAWAATQLFVWGDSSPALYDPGTDQWRGVNMDGAPSPRSQPIVVWTGRYVLVWGGRSGTALLGDGAIYDLAGDRWRPMATDHSPAARTGRGVWSGSALLVWGGVSWATQSALNDGAAFYPPAN